MAKKQMVTTEAPMAPDDETQRIAARIFAIQAETTWDLPVAEGAPLGGKALDAWLTAKEDQAAVNIVERGLGYLLKKRELGHGAFLAWVKDTGRSARAVQEAAQVAVLLTALSDENARRGAHLPHRKLRVLASAAPKLVDELFDRGALDGAGDLKIEDIKEIIRLQKENHHLLTELEKAELRMARAKGQEPETPPYPPTIMKVRRESAHLADRINLCLDDLERLLTELLGAGDLSSGRDQRQAELSAGATTLYLNLAAGHAKSAYLLRWYEQQLGKDFVPTQSADIHHFTEAEARRLVAMREVMVQEHRADELVREVAAGHQKKRGPKPKARRA